jgi:hypothetical protein
MAFMDFLYAYKFSLQPSIYNNLLEEEATIKTSHFSNNSLMEE